VLPTINAAAVFSAGSIELAELGDVWRALADPWGEAIMQRAFAEIALLGLVGGALGAWLVLYELSYSAESLAHAIFPGLVVGALTGLPLVLAGAAGLVVAAIAIALAGRASEIGPDTAVAVVVSGLLGLGAVLALAAASPPGLQGLLFGDILGVSNLDLSLSVALAGLAVAMLWLLHRELLVVGFDRASASALGGHPLLADTALLLLLALSVLVGVQGLGALLVVTILIGPAASARLVAHRMVPMMGLATLYAVAAGAGGLYLSYYADTAGGASIAGAVVALYLALWALASRRRPRNGTRAWRTGYS
jgi:ABC-type Mn2+/Zn2+ transport system permease subunit